MPVPQDHDGCVICEYNTAKGQITIHYACFDPEPYIAENAVRQEHSGTPDDGPSVWFQPRFEYVTPDWEPVS